jgi:hypothetical protein
LKTVRSQTSPSSPLKGMASPRMSKTSRMLTTYRQAWSTRRSRPSNKRGPQHPSPLPQNKGKGHARMTSEDSVIVRPRSTTSRASRRDPSRDDNRPRRSQSTARPPRETRSRQSVADSDQDSEYPSASHHSPYDLTRLLRRVGSCSGGQACPSRL